MCLAKLNKVAIRIHHQRISFSPWSRTLTISRGVSESLQRSAGLVAAFGQQIPF